MSARVLEVGDRIRDNDPRMPNRILEIVSFNGQGRAIVRDWSGRRFRIDLRRIFTDGKARRHGFNLIESVSVDKRWMS